MLSAAAENQVTTILLVEDDDLLRDLLTEVLEAESYRVLAAAGPSEALDLASQCGDTISLAISDVVMPGMTGMEFAKRIRGTRPEIRVLLMSGYPRDFVASKGVADPRDQFITKPFSNGFLVELVRDTLDAA